MAHILGDKNNIGKVKVKRKGKLMLLCFLSSEFFGGEGGESTARTKFSPLISAPIGQFDLVPVLVLSWAAF